ncbi:dipeptidase [Metasolibacillus meyeri]|uniref:dipeptidase n=1 Tax=Metasolibacillus meyeri TaxID=1071052 RepID=UPI000D3018AB|nr:dipeptidase [Metasolibacillus meyeri]
MLLPIIDLHCDVLYKYEKKEFDFLNAPFDVNLQNLRQGNVKVQAFAIFIHPTVPKAEKIKSALHQIYYFKTHVVRPENKVVHIKNWSDIEQLQDDEIGAILTIEGVDFFEGDIKMWHLFREFGVLSIGLTWNNANEAADGVQEDTKQGVKAFGREIIQLNNAHQIFTDVSHLSEKSFWDTLELADYVIASHSNAKTLCAHPRNLSDAQIKAMVEKNAPIHIVYCPMFIVEQGEAIIADLIKHIDHICALGGQHLIGLGSDFDGIDQKVQQLENASQHSNLLNELLKYYSEDAVRGFAGQNFLNHLPKQL